MDPTVYWEPQGFSHHALSPLGLLGYDRGIIFSGLDFHHPLGLGLARGGVRRPRISEIALG